MARHRVLELQTEIAGLLVREHTGADAGPYYELVQANRDYLTRHGDYTELVAATRREIERQLVAPGRERSLRDLEGRPTDRSRDIVHGVPPTWGLGFWLSEHASGHGYMTRAIGALLAYARSELQALEVLAGVTHGNHRSSAVLARLGFTPIKEFPSYTRYRLGLA